MTQVDHSTCLTINFSMQLERTTSWSQGQCSTFASPEGTTVSHCYTINIAKGPQQEYYFDSSFSEPRFVLVPRAGLGKLWSASNANKPASSWPLKQDPKKWSKHGCDKGTLTVSWVGLKDVVSAASNLDSAQILALTQWCQEQVRWTA